MQVVKNNWPVPVGVVIVALFFIAQNRNFLTADQVSVIFALLGIGGAGATYRMAPPSKVPSNVNPTDVS